MVRKEQIFSNLLDTDWGFFNPLQEDTSDLARVFKYSPMLVQKSPDPTLSPATEASEAVDPLGADRHTSWDIARNRNNPSNIFILSESMKLLMMNKTQFDYS